MSPLRLLAAAASLLALVAGLAGAKAAAATPRITAAADCPTNLAESLSRTDGARELITVVAPSMASTHATVTDFVRRGSCFTQVAGPYPARVGALGLSTDHREGIPTTPVGIFSIGPVMYGTEPNPGVAYAYHRLVCGDWWDEDPASPEYNRFVHVPCGARPDFDNGEALWTEANAYAYFAVIDYNTSPVVPGRGSGIFFHLSTDSPTAGCVSLGRTGLVTTLRLLRPDDDPRIVIGAAGSLRHL